MTEIEEELKKAQRLNDEAEELLDNILKITLRGGDPRILHPSIDNVWLKLNEAREKDGRELNTE